MMKLTIADAEGCWTAAKWLNELPQSHKPFDSATTVSRIQLRTTSPGLHRSRNLTPVPSSFKRHSDV
jgi:hypothetical protein